MAPGQVTGPGGAVLQREVEEEFDEEVLVPENFSMVDRGVYRSSFPMKKHFPFIKRLRLKAILTLVMEEYPPANVDFVHANSIKLFQIGVDGNKEPFKHIPIADTQLALETMCDPANHPILIHCNKGKHRTGCLVGCYRKATGWALSSIFDEYNRFAIPKARLVDQRYIELFQYQCQDQNGRGRSARRRKAGSKWAQKEQQEQQREQQLVIQQPLLLLERGPAAQAVGGEQAIRSSIVPT